MADLAKYQNEANQIYGPQLQAEQGQAALKRDTTITSLADEEKTIEPAYQRAIRTLNDQTTQNEGKISQLYSQRLGGQFSGLQGNDTSMMYGKAAQVQGELETQRADKLAGIASRRTLANTGYAADINSATSRITGQKNQYAITNFNSAQQAEAKPAPVAKTANATTKTNTKQLPNDIISYFMSAPSQYGNYNRNGTNYHRWQAAEQELIANGIDPYSGAVRQQLIQTFGSPDERASLKK